MEAVESACNRLAYKFRFGYHELEDMKQEAFIFTVEAIRDGKWDESRPLNNFVYVHIHNRFFNFKRKYYQRLSPPCEKCPLKAYRAEDDKCLAYELKDDCKWYRAWTNRNERKKQLMHTVELTSSSHPESLDKKFFENDDYLNWIEQFIPDVYRKTWELARSGERYNVANFKEMIIWLRENVVL